MGDPSSMTIEFLRARLLSERSISRSARQRAEQLAKRVVELEEQLKIVTIQRKKAEKAASEVLNILEVQGISDLSSEVIDSCSDREKSQDDRSDGSAKKDDSAATSRMVTEVSPISGKGLSWKGNINMSESAEKKNIFQFRQRYRSNEILFAAESSSKPQLGKSCRKLKRREKRDAAANGNGDGFLHDYDRTEYIKCTAGAANSCSDGNFSLADGTSEINHEDRGSSACSFKGERRDREINFYTSQNYIDEQMELAIEKQAKLIGQYQEEENAQREWEKIYQNNCAPLDCDSSGVIPGANENKSDLKKDGTILDCLCYDDENSSKEHVNDTNKQSGEVSTNTSGDKRKMDMPSFYISHAAPTHSFHSVDVHFDGSSSTCPNQGGSSQELKMHGLVAKSEQPHQSVDYNIVNTTVGAEPNITRSLITKDKDRPCVAPSNSNSSKVIPSDIQSKLLRPEPEATGKGLVGVLDALRRAKLSLRQELDRTPELVVPTSLSITAYPQVCNVKRTVDLGIPVGSPGLFRLPTDNLPISLSKRSYLKSSIRLPGPFYTSSSTVSGTSSSKQYVMPSTEIQYSKPAGKGFDSCMNPVIGNPSANFSRYYPDPLGSSVAASLGVMRKPLAGSKMDQSTADQFTNYSTNDQKISSLQSRH